ITGGAGNDTITGGGGNDVINGGAGSDVLVFAATGASNGADTITFVSGAGGDVMNFANFLPGGSVDQHGGAGTAIIAYTSSSNGNANITNKVALYSDPTATDIDTATKIAIVINSDDFSFTSGGKMILITGDAGGGDPARVWFIDSTLDGNGTNVTSTDVVLVGTTSGNFDLDTLITTNFAFTTAPAGVAGSPINLALTDPSGVGALTTMTISGMPADWRLNQGTNLGNGTWTVETDDLSALTVLTAAAYAGAVVLGVTETWANADGSTGTAFVSDNVEAYAPGSPIFAWSGDDTLTGSSGADLFVFAQPIGNDTIYNFNVAADRIDLTGFAGITGFGDLAGHIADAGHGDAVITLGSGETITLHGVDAASLTAVDFVFDQTPVVDNAGTMTIGDGAMLPLGGIVNNTGTIALNSSGDETDLQIVGHGVTLEGGGQLTLSDSHENVIFGTAAGAMLTNVDNTISGAGQIGIGDGNLTLVNEAHGTIDANYADGTLTLDTGNAIVNDGILEATNGGTLQIDDPVSGGGGAIIAGGTLVFDAQSNMNVTFDNGSGTPAYGELVLGVASDFSGQIFGFTGTAPDTAHSDAIDLKDIAFISDIIFAYQDDAGTDTGGMLTLLESGNVVDSITFANGEYTTASFTLSSDGSGGTLITDPPTSTTTSNHLATSDSFVFNGSANADTLIGGSQHETFIGGGGGDTMTGGGGSDTFAFKAITDSQPGTGHFDTITDFTAGLDHIDLSAITGVNSNNQAVNFQSLTSLPATLAAHTIDIVTMNGNTVIYANASAATQSIGSPDMEIHLNNVTNVHSSDFIIH
ncbi:MAG TPA: hypothetical protein VMT22_14790, partial [Terriglobales bacterium]|nr:hypothetical protein [Terriglobales bacterium]